MEELNEKKIKKLNKLNEKYKIHDNLVIGRCARKTIRYVERNISNFPNKYSILKNRIIDSCYNILECIYSVTVI